MREFGYVRVSSKEQNIDRQMSAMAALGIAPDKIYIDRQSGKDFERPRYKSLVKRFKGGDVLFIKSIDRLGRNYEEILEQWKYLTTIKDIDIVVIDFPLLNTRNQLNGVTGRFIADMVLQVLSYIAQVERENTHQRQAEGIKEAMKKGIKFGRPRNDPPKEFEAMYKLWKDESISKREAARRLGTNHCTFSRWINMYRSRRLRKSDTSLNK